MKNKEMKNKGLLIRKIIAAVLLMVGLTADILGQPDMTAKTQPSDDEAAKKVDAFLFVS